MAFVGRGSLANVAVGKAVAEGKRLPPSLFSRGREHASGALDNRPDHPDTHRHGAGLLVDPVQPGGVRALRKLGRELRDSNLPESDLIIPKPFDRP